jgi:dihydroflavonol-4-reductase
MADDTLVTGGAGFVGRHLVERLVEIGASVRVLDLPGERLAHVPQETRVFAGDIRDRDLVRRAAAGCRTVFHLAANPQLWAARRGDFEQVNHRAAVQLFDEALAAGARVVHVSSATVWPRSGRIEPGKDPRRECDFPGPYSRAKLRAERAALQRAWAGAPIIVVSPTLPIGPGDFVGTPPTRMLLDFLRHPRREYLDASLNLIDVRDVAEATIRAALHGQPGRPYLLGHRTIALPDLVAALGLPRPDRPIPYALALAVAHLAEWWANVVTRRAPLAAVAGVQLTRVPPPPDADADVRALGVTPRPLEQTLDDFKAWLHASARQT